MKVALFANTDWYLYNFRKSLAEKLQADGYEVVLLAPRGPYMERLERLGFKCAAVPMHRRSLNPWSELRVILWLSKVIVKEEIELIHSFTIKCAVYGGIAARLAGDKNRIGAVAGLGYVFTSSHWRAKLLRPLVCTAMRGAFGGGRSRVILQNPDDLNVLLRSNVVHSSSVRLIRSSGVDCQRFSHAGARESGSPLRVLLAARLLWAKGIREFTEAARLLKNKGCNVQFLLAGDPDPGNPDSVSEDTLRQWNKEGLVDWLGHVEDMSRLLATVHVMALPSTYGEGVPRSLIEAAACGLALVTTDAPGCREVVIHEVNGLLIPGRNAAALADAVARLEASPELVLRFGQAAQHKARLEFSEQTVLQQTIDVYTELAESTLQ